MSKSCKCEVAPICLYRTSSTCSFWSDGLLLTFITISTNPIFPLILTIKLLIHCQAELHALQLLSHMEGNSPSLSSQPVLHKEPVLLHCNSPVMEAIPCLGAICFAHIRVVRMIALQPFLVGHVILPCHITPSPLLVKSAYHTLADLLVTFSLLHHYHLKAFLMWSAILLLRMSLPCLLKRILSLLVRSARRVPVSQNPKPCH